MERRIDPAGGMTLIELLVVLVIVAVLTAIAIPRYSTIKDRARISAAETDLYQAMRGLWLYQTENDSLHHPETDMITNHQQLRQVVRDYIGLIPNEENSNFVFVSYAADDTSFTIVARAKDSRSTILTGSMDGITRTVP
ncbi:MAG: prepilin-type N-terminal cleavage/methylation domain-containing protein [bacterium]